MKEAQIGELIIRLLESKCKNYTANTIKIWVDELKTFDLNFLPKVIKQLIYSSDDFPSIGKIYEFIQDEIDNNILELMKNPSEEIKQFANKHGINLEKFNSGEYSHDAYQRCLERFTKIYKNKDKKQIENNKIDNKMNDFIKSVSDSISEKKLIKENKL